MSATPCVGRWELFDSTHPADHIEARKLCATCPVIAWCRGELRAAQAAAAGAGATGGPQGTWAGRLFRVTERVKQEPVSIGECPLCGVPDGTMCVSSRGKPRGHPHAARHDGLPACRACRTQFKPSPALIHYCSAACSLEGRRESSRKWHRNNFERAV